MSRITDPTGRIVPCIPKAQQAGSPHTSAGELALSERVVQVWYESIKQHRCFPFVNPATAPSVTIAASFTDYTFAFQDGTWDDTLYLPWCMPSDADTVRMHLVLATKQPINGLAIWAETQTLSAAVTTVVGPMVSAGAANEQPPWGPWRNGADVYNLRRVDLEVRDPDLTPGGGEIAIVLKAQWRPTGEPVTVEAADLSVWLFAATVWNDVRNMKDT